VKDKEDAVYELIKFGVKCRLAGGHPVFKTRYIREFPGVLAVCYGASDEVKSELFEVPEELRLKLRETHEDWRSLVREYPDLVEKALKEVKVENPVPV